MAEGVRSPTGHKTPAQRRRERAVRKHDPEYQRKKKIWDKNYNADRNKDGRVPDSKRGSHRGHKTPLSEGGSNAASNRERQSPSENMGHGKGRSGSAPSAKTRQIRKRLGL